MRHSVGQCNSVIRVRPAEKYPLSLCATHTCRTSRARSGRAGAAAATLAYLRLPTAAQTIRWARQFGTSSTEIACAIATADRSSYVAGEIMNGAYS